MPTSVISNTCLTATGEGLAGVEVTATLWPGPGFRVADDSEVAGVVRTDTDATGDWSLALEETAGISPAETAYVIEEKFPDRHGGPRVYLIQVGADDATLLESLVSGLVEPTLAVYLTQAAADARYSEGLHPDLAEHDLLGLATQAELDAVAAAKANTSHSHVDADLPAGIARDTEVTAAVSAHAGAGDPHPAYRLEAVPIAAADVAADVATQAELDAVAAAKANTSHSHVDADLPAGIARDTEVTSAIAAHAATPHGTAHPDLASHDTLGLATQAELDAHVNDTTAAHAASAISFTPAGTVAATTVQAAIEEVASEAGGTHPNLAAHDTLGLATQTELDAVAAAKANTSHSHVDADLPAGIARDTEVTSAISTHAGAADPHAGYRLESVPIAAADVAADVATQAELDAHVNDTTAAHAATAISFTPTGTIAATTVQAAIAEVASEAAGGAAALNDLTDVDTTGAAADDVLAYDGTDWGPRPVALLTDTAPPSNSGTDPAVGDSEEAARSNHNHGELHLVSPDTTVWRLLVSDAGVLSAEEVVVTGPTTFGPIQAPQGNWSDAGFGTDGYALLSFPGPADVVSMPLCSLARTQGAENYWTGTSYSTPMRALQDPANLLADGRIGAWYDATAVIATLTFTAAYTGMVRVYCIDWDDTTRRETVKIDDGSAPAAVDLGGQFDQGLWVGRTVDVAASGTVVITVTNLGGGSANAVLSGIFLDPS